MMLINGCEQHNISALDRAIAYGDGCFTTARIQHHQVCFMADHIQRLSEGCERLGIRFGHWQALQQEMCQLASKQASGVLKVIISRGQGGRGYGSQGCDSPNRIVTVAEYPKHYVAWQQQGIALTTSTIRLAQQPHLAGIKHLNRLEQVLIKQQLELVEGQEALVLDQQDKMVSCCAANIFWRKEQQLFTPDLKKSGVNGTMRQRLIKVMASLGYVCQEVNESKQALEHADEIFICNALMPIIPVIAIDDWRYQPGHIFEKLKSLGFTAG